MVGIIPRARCEHGGIRSDRGPTPRENATQLLGGAALNARSAEQALVRCAIVSTRLIVQQAGQPLSARTARGISTIDHQGEIGAKIATVRDPNPTQPRRR